VRPPCTRISDREHNTSVSEALEGPQIKPSPGVSRFVDAVRRPGDGNALRGPRALLGKGAIMERQCGIATGSYGLGKTFVLIDMTVHVAKGLEWAGAPTLEGGAIYVTGEGQAGLEKRIAALISEFGLTADDPFIYLPIMPRLLELEEVKDFISAMKTATAQWKMPTRLMTFDTLNRSLLGGDENDGRDITKLLAADSLIREEFGCATLYAHHPGKAGGNELRGHSSLGGNFDVIWAFTEKDGVRQFEVRKQKDGEAGTKFTYRLRPIQLGHHELTKEVVTTCVVDWTEPSPVQPTRGRKLAWPRKLNLFRRALVNAIASSGYAHNAHNDRLVVQAVAVEDVRAEFARHYVYGGDGGEKERVAALAKAWKRALQDAQTDQLIAGEVRCNREIIWLVSP
jgi:AAA domain-containing protein